MTIERFIGTWQFDPLQAQYEFGQPPRSGSYRIELDGDALKFTAEWVTAEGKANQVTYHSIPDGQDHPYQNLLVATTLVDARTLDSTTKKDGAIIAYARRFLSADGQRMTVTQSGQNDKGMPFDNVAVYRKQ